MSFQKGWTKVHLLAFGRNYSLTNISPSCMGRTMANLDFGDTPDVASKTNKNFGSVVTALDLAITFELSLKRELSALQRGPVRFYRDNLIVCAGDAADYIFFVASGVVRSCKMFENGTRSVVAFYLPGDLFGWTDQKHSLSIEAATDASVLFLKRGALLSLASRESRIASYLFEATTNELGRAQEHIMLMSKSARCRVATFFTDLWMRLGQAKYLDVPMSYQDIADYLGLTIETLSRNITDLERAGLMARVAGRRLLLRNRFALGYMMN